MQKPLIQLANQIDKLLAGSTAVRLTVPSFMPLVVEDIGPSPDGNRQVSVAHYGTQNGDAMRDPEIVFEFYDMRRGTIASPNYFRNDYVAIEQFVFDYDESGQKRCARVKLHQDLQSFAKTWFQNLKDQGFFSANVDRTILD